MLNFFVLGIALAVASFMDLRSREVDDWVWIIAFITAPFFIFFKALDYSIYVFALPVFAIAITILLTGLIGGADAKALFALALFAPEQSLLILLIALLLELVAFAHIPLMNFVRLLQKSNYASELSFLPKWKRILLLLCSTKLQKNPKYLEWMKVFDKDKVLFLVDIEDELPRAEAGDWATPLIPFIPFLSISFLLVFFIL